MNNVIKLSDHRPTTWFIARLRNQNKKPRSIYYGGWSTLGKPSFDDVVSAMRSTIRTRQQLVDFYHEKIVTIADGSQFQLQKDIWAGK